MEVKVLVIYSMCWAIDPTVDAWKVDGCQSRWYAIVMKKAWK